MASLLVRLEGSAAGGNSLLGRTTSIAKSVSAGILRFTSASNMSLPRLMLPPAFDDGNMVYQMYNLAEDRVETPYRRRIKRSKEEELDSKVVGSSHGWLALFHSRICNNNIFLSNPLTCRQIKLPSYDTLCDPGDEKCQFTLSKIILSCSPSSDEKEECRAFMSYGFGRPNRLAFCLPGKSTHWTFVGKFDDEDVDDKYALGYSDTIYSARHKLFFCITKINYFQVCDLNQGIELSDWNWVGKLKGEDVLYNDVLHKSVVRPDLREQLYLVEHSGQLFLVRRHIMARVGHDGAFVRPFYFGHRRGWDNSHPYKTVGFDVHKIEWDVKSGKTKATYMEPGGSLGGLTMFVGLNHSLALSAAEFPELKPNSIYFTDSMRDATPIEGDDWGDEEPPHPEWNARNYGGHDIGIFNYEDRTFSPCYYPCDVQCIKRINPPPFWFTPSLHN